MFDDEQEFFEAYAQETIEEYTDIFINNGNTFDFLVKKFDSMEYRSEYASPNSPTQYPRSTKCMHSSGQFMFYREDMVIDLLFYKMRKAKSKAVQVQMVTDLFLLPYYFLKKHNQIFDILYVYNCSYNSMFHEMATFLQESGCYRKVLVMLTDFFLILENLRKKQTLINNARRNEVFDSPFSDWDFGYDDPILDVLEAIAETEGRPFPDEDEEEEMLDFDEEENPTVSRYIENIGYLDPYINLITDATDIDIPEKIVALRVMDKILKDFELPLWISSVARTLSSME